MKKETIRTIFITVIAIIASVCLIRFFIAEPYTVTPGQMENSLLPGDQLWVDKWSFRWGNRMPDRRDIVVFKLPQDHQPQSYNDQIAVARCSGIPGDTIKSDGKRLFVNNKPVAQPPLILEAYLSPDSVKNSVNHILRQNRAHFVEQGKVHDNRLLFLSRYDYEKVRKELSADSLLYPVFLNRDSYEITLPRKGETIKITPENAQTLYRLLSCFENRKVEYKAGKIYENGKPLSTCRLSQNYYWVIGDNRAGMADSRTFGILPHSLLIGKGAFIGYSRDPQKSFWKSFRTDRFFKTQL
ncbi:MAG TPA: signal peptidase I [Candidatus Barnesiella excrementigallinarum]|nr:signal peptidase I [Candidatus Barnesiella excrementigallinarum]